MGVALVIFQVWKFWGNCKLSNILHFVFKLVGFGLRKKFNGVLRTICQISQMGVWLRSGRTSRAEANGGAGGGGAEPPPQQTICRKILLSCRNFCVLNN